MLIVGFNTIAAMETTETTFLEELAGVIRKDLKDAVRAGDRATVNKVIQEAEMLSADDRPLITWVKSDIPSSDVNKAFNIIKNVWGNAQQKNKIEALWARKKEELKLTVLAQAIVARDYGLVKQFISFIPLLLFPVDYCCDRENEDLCKAALLTDDANIQKTIFQQIVNNTTMHPLPLMLHNKELVRQLVAADNFNAVKMLFTYYDRNPGLKKEVFTKSFVESLELARRNSLMVQFINDYSSDAPATNAEWETDARVQLKPQEKVDILKVRVVRHRLAEAV